MARAAADDTTGGAIDAALGLPAGVAAHEAWDAAASAIAASAAATEQVTVVIADRIWPRAGVDPSQEWVDLLAAHHNVDVQPLDFAGEPDASRRTINDWVGEQTHGLIPDLLDGFIQPTTVLVLTDTLHLEARWQQPFGKYGTEDGRFTRLDGSTVPVELMRELELDDRRGRGDGFVAADIPYEGGDLAMLVRDGPQDVVRERRLHPHVVGLDPVESAELLDHPYRQATHPELQCRFRWSAGDVAFWDNRSTQHYAASDYYPQRRVMERITIVGVRPH